MYNTLTVTHHPGLKRIEIKDIPRSAFDIGLFPALVTKFHLWALSTISLLRPTTPFAVVAISTTANCDGAQPQYPDVHPAASLSKYMSIFLNSVI